jgi:hypothetical protein
MMKYLGANNAHAGTAATIFAIKAHMVDCQQQNWNKKNFFGPGGEEVGKCLTSMWHSSIVRFTI